jgi:hypothetical protein
VIIAMVNEAAERMMADFGLPVGLVIIDTTSRAAGYTKAGEDNDPVLGQIVVDTMKAVAKGVKAFVLGVAHFGKDASTGTRGAMSKEDAVDFILALLGERDLAGNVTNPRAAIRKRRSGPVGLEFPFQVEVVDMGFDHYGQPLSTLTINWAAPVPEGRPKEKSAWPKSLKLFQNALVNSLASADVEQHPAPDMPLVRAVDIDVLRMEFYRTHVTEAGTREQKQDSRRKAFTRAITAAQKAGLIGVCNSNDRTLVWLVEPAA